MTPLAVVSLSDSICPGAKSERVPRLVRRKVVMLLPFTVWTWKALSIICFWSGDQGLWYRNISSEYHRCPELWYYYYFLFSEEKPLREKETKHTHTHTHTHTYTYIHTHIDTHTKSLKNGYRFLLKSQFMNKTLLKCFKNR